MKLARLREICRLEIDDVAEPYGVTDEDLDECINDAQNEACRRARLLRDSTTTATSTIALVANTATYALDPRVIRVDRARISGETSPLAMMLMRDADRLLPGWEDYSAATPYTLIPDYESGKIRLIPKPSANGTLLLTVIRLPLAEMDNDDDDLSIPEHHQRSLRHWVAYRIFSRPDSQLHDPKAAENSLTLFMAEFGQAQPAYDEAWVQTHYAGREYGHY